MTLTRADDMHAASTLNTAAKHATEDSIKMLVPGDSVQNVDPAGDGTRAWLTFSKRTSLSSLKRRM